MTESKIILFIVEGMSDEVALAPALEQIITDNTIKFKVMRSDITCDFDSTITNIERRIKNLGVKKFLDENSQFTEKDIHAVVHIVDLDGAFSPDTIVVEDTAIEKVQYYDNSIVCKNRNLFLQTKNNKKLVLLHLCSLQEIAIPKGIKVPYYIYYMACNLDHVLHNNRNSTEVEKKRNSIDFSDKYEDPQLFEQFFNEETIKINGTYEETWKYVQRDCNSLLRGSNFWLCINDHKS